jgi:hypothetical protein
VAAPVFGAAGAFLGALSLAGPATRFDDAALPRLRWSVLEAAADVAVASGCPMGVYRGALERAALPPTVKAGAGPTPEALDAD